MSRYAQPAVALRSAFPHGRYLQALGESTTETGPIVEAFTEARPGRADQNGLHTEAGHIVLPVDDAPAVTAKSSLPWRQLARYPLILAVALGLIYLAYRFHLASHWLFLPVVGVLTIALIMGMFIWGMRQEQRKGERRQRLRMQMAGLSSSSAKDANPAQHLYDQAMQLIQMGEHEEAIVYLRKALQLNPRFIEVYQALGNAYNALGEPELAVEMTQRAFEIKVQGHGE